MKTSFRKTSFSLSGAVSQLRQQIKTSRKQNERTLPVHIGYGIFFIHLLIYAFRFIIAMVRLDYSLLPMHPLYLLFWCAAPVFLYLWGTKTSFYNFRNTKCCCLAAVLFSEYLAALSLVFFLLSRIFLPGILSLPVDEAFTKGMVILLRAACHPAPPAAYRHPACKGSVSAHKGRGGAEKGAGVQDHAQHLP